MKILKVLLTLCVFLVVTWLSINTIAAQKIIPLNPVSMVGLPTTTWSDAAHFLQSQTKNLDSMQTASTSSWLSSSWQSVQKEIGTVATRTQEAVGHAQNVTGNKPLIGLANPSSTPTPITNPTTSTPSASNQTVPLVTPTPEPFYTKAIDYSKYVYCQEVVRDYELQHPEVKK